MQELRGKQTLPGGGAFVDAEGDLREGAENVIHTFSEGALPFFLNVQPVGNENIGADAGNLHHVLNFTVLRFSVAGSMAGGHDLNAAVYGFGDTFCDVQLLLLGEIEHLRRLADGKNTVTAMLYVPVGQLFDCFKIRCVVFLPGGDHHREYAGVD